MVLLVQIHTVLNCLHMTGKVREVCIKILDVTQAVTPLHTQKKDGEYSQMKVKLVKEKKRLELSK